MMRPGWGAAPIFLAPQAQFSVSTDGLTAAFTDSSTGNPTRWQWELGDGAASQEQNPVHRYAGEGTYAVSLTAANPDGESRASQLITVPREPAPVAAFSFEVRGLTVLFTDTSSGEPVAWEWELGDGSGSRKQSPSHTYAAAGTYVVHLTVTNASGQAAEVSRFVEVL